MTIAPWLIPPDFIGASKAGAALGLQRAEIFSRANEAANKLKQEASESAAANALRQSLGLAELASRERVASINSGADSAARSLRSGELDLSRNRLDFDREKTKQTLSRQLALDAERGKLTQQQAASYGTRLLGVLGNYMTDPATKDAAKKNYTKLQEEFPDVLSPLGAIGPTLTNSPGIRILNIRQK